MPYQYPYMFTSVFRYGQHVKTVKYYHEDCVYNPVTYRLTSPNEIACISLFYGIVIHTVCCICVIFVHM